MTVFMQHELESITAELDVEFDDARRSRLYAAQQALAWALNPSAFLSPLELLASEKACSLGRRALTVRSAIGRDSATDTPAEVSWPRHL
jgi:hypothetical protein